MGRSRPNDRLVLVTGASGFVGRQTLEPLTAAGCQVAAVHRGAPGPDLPGVAWRQADLLSADATRRLVRDIQPSHLLASAWHMGPGNMGALENFRWLQATVELLLAFAETGGKRALVVGSCAEYDWSAGRMSEAETPLRPGSPYGAAKLALATAFASICAATSISGAWARPFFMYGPGEAPHRLAADVILSLLSHREALCSHGAQRRDFMHVADVGAALAAILDSDAEGAVNVGTGQAVSVAELVSEIARQLEAQELVHLGARTTPPDTPDLIEADPGRLFDELGWRPRFDLSSGLADTIAWWRDNLPERVSA